MSESGYESPVNAVPGVVWVLALAVFGVEVALMAGEAGLVGGARAVGWRLALMQDYAFSPRSGTMRCRAAGRPRSCAGS